MNDIQEVSGLTAFLSLATCGEGCWYAREDVCRCYCGGRNHGCLKTPGGISPMRMAKIDGIMYQLKSFGKYEDIYHQARDINNASPMRTGKSSWKPEGYVYQETNPGAPARMKPPTYDQTQRWPELAQFKGLDKRGIFQANGCKALYGLWVRL